MKEQAINFLRCRADPNMADRVPWTGARDLGGWERLFVTEEGWKRGFHPKRGGKTVVESLVAQRNWSGLKFYN